MGHFGHFHKLLPGLERVFLDFCKHQTELPNLRELCSDATFSRQVVGWSLCCAFPGVWPLLHFPLNSSFILYEYEWEKDSFSALWGMGSTVPYGGCY